MKVGIILLSQDNFYVDKHNNLPKRPKFDKELLKALCKGQRVVVGPNTRHAMPPSILGTTTQVPWEDEYDLNLGMVTLQINPPNLLIVVRSATYLHAGKHLSLKDYNRYYDGDSLEIWIHK